MIRRRVGGRWALSWQGYLLLWPIAVVLMVLTVENFFTPSHWLRGALVGTVSYAAVGVVLLVASWTVLRHRVTRPVSLFAVAMVGGLAWVARSAVLVAYLSETSAPESVLIGQRLFTGFVLGATLVPGMAYVLASLADFSTARQQSLDRLVGQELAAHDSAAYLEVMRAEVLARVSRQVRSSIDELSATGVAGGGSASDPDSSIASVKALELAARTASHDLVDDVRAEAMAASRVRVRFVVDLLVRHPFSIWPLPIWAFTALLVLIRYVPWNSAVVLVSAASLWSLVAVVVGNKLCGRQTRAAGLRYSVALVIMFLNGLFAGCILNIIGLYPGFDPQLSLTMSATSSFFMALGGLAGSINVAEDRVLRDMAASISEGEVRARALELEELRVREEIAVHLHGTVAANVTAASMRLRLAMSEGDEAAAQQARTELSRQLEIDMSSAVLVERSDLAALLTDLAYSWRGIADIEVVIDIDEAMTPALVRRIGQAVTEGVSNAIRHANAQHMAVRVMSRHDLVLVSIVDDGCAVGPSARGLGSSLFDTWSDGGWSLTPNVDRGSTLEIRIAAGDHRQSG